MAYLTTLSRTRASRPTPIRRQGGRLRIAGRDLQPTPAFDTYWRFAAERQRVYMARLAQQQPPWTDDEIISQHRFTNCYRAADRVSQFLIRDVIYTDARHDWENTFFRILLFKLFNRVSTWTLLEDKVGAITWDDYSYAKLDRILSRAFQAGERLYSAAYVIPPPQLGADRKHSNHLRLLEHLMRSGAPERIGAASTMQEAFLILRSFPAMGEFLGYQFLIDLNYCGYLNFDEMEFVVPGPGARDGLMKCFGPASAGIEAEIIRYMADTQLEHFERLGLRFETLGGRALKLIDCQNLFCEVDKYSRVAHPEIAGHSGRTRIKQVYRRDHAPMTAWFPPKWGINERFAIITHRPNG